MGETLGISRLTLSLYDSVEGDPGRMVSYTGGRDAYKYYSLKMHLLRAFGLTDTTFNSPYSLAGHCSHDTGSPGRTARLSGLNSLKTSPCGHFPK